MTKDSERKFLEGLVAEYQEIQKSDPPTSVKWITASREINAIARLLSGPIAKARN